MIRLNPKVDIAFRKLFGSEENKEILRSFINSVLPQEEQVKTLEIKNPYNVTTYIGGKTGILDVKAQGEDGRWFDVELQIGEQEFFGKRIKYYLDKVYVDQIIQAGEYSSLKKVIGIAILDFNYFLDERYTRAVTYKDKETNEVYEKLDLCDIYFIELKKFGKDLKDLTTTLDRWITFLNKAYEYSKDFIPPELAVDENIKKAIEKLDVMYLDKDEREIYEIEEKKRLDILEEMRTAEEKGRQEGKEEGIKEGIKEGEKNKAIEMAKKMLIKGISLEEISELTDLAIKDIEKLK
jgi:predicted transposase/invertase (TIGR01784 family)